MRNKKPIVIFGLFVAIVLFVFVGGFFYFFLTDDGDGRVYKSKQDLCLDFAQSYLRTIHKTEKDHNNKKWNLAVDVETDLYNLCQADLTEESLRKFELSAIRKYK